MQHALDESSKDLISDFTVINFLQVIEMEEKTCTIEITSKGKIGYLHLKDGQLIDAEANELTGDSAAIEILGWDGTEMKIEEIAGERHKKYVDLTIKWVEASMQRLAAKN